MDTSNVTYSRTAEEIDEELLRIDKKYNISSSSDLSDTYLQRLLREFDSLGIVSKNNDITVNSFKLINVYRNTLRKVQECNSLLTKTKAENVELKKKIFELEEKLNAKAVTIDDMRKKSVLSNLDKDQLQTDKAKLLKDLKFLRKVIENKENLWEKRLQQLSSENTSLKSQIGKNIGRYSSQSDVITSTISRYKQNEEVYKDTIEKLQDNNRGLLDEILNLKEEVLISLISKNRI